MRESFWPAPIGFILSVADQPVGEPRDPRRAGACSCARASDNVTANHEARVDRRPREGAGGFGRSWPRSGAGAARSREGAGAG